MTYERLRLGGVGVGVENLVEARVALLRVEEVAELLGRQVRLLVRAPACGKQPMLSRLHAVNNECCRSSAEKLKNYIIGLLVLCIAFCSIKYDTCTRNIFVTSCRPDGNIGHQRLATTSQARVRIELHEATFKQHPNAQTKGKSMDVFFQLKCWAETKHQNR